MKMCSHVQYVKVAILRYSEQISHKLVEVAMFTLECCFATCWTPFMSIGCVCQINLRECQTGSFLLLYIIRMPS